MLTFLGLIFSISVVALQLASNQFSPRVMRIFQRDRKTQIVLGTFLGTFVFSLTAIAELGETRRNSAPVLVGVAFVLVAASLVAFVAYLQHITWSLRAVAIIENIAEETRHAIDHPLHDRVSVGVAVAPADDGPVTVLHGTASGVLDSIDIRALVERAATADAFVRVRHPVGTYLGFAEPLLEVHAASLAHPASLLHTVEIGPARTMLQDVGFGIRQLVDIAERALSPAVNDPTTGVQALDRIGDLLARIGMAPDPPTLFHDAAGVARLEWPAPTWDAFVDLAFNEIRWFGQTSMQVTRRMAAIIGYLLEVTPEPRHAALHRARADLEEAVALGVPEPLRAYAADADGLGIGGHA